MHSVKRLKIIVSSRETHKTLEQPDKAGVRGYSVIRDVVSKGGGGQPPTE
ncbi:hypothetical protein [Leptolyngbya sp. BC1307]|nr:hypothetical protein [Leptolyngbya sp. BC1307]